MTSVSQQSQIPSQPANSSSASSTSSYASTAKKAVSSPPIATGSSTPSPAVAVGGSAPVQHGKSSSVSPVNGRPPISPAVPAVAAPAIAHGGASVNGGSNNHSRKSSVTISANGPSGYVSNGGPVGGKGLQFGSASPAASHSTPQISQPATAPIPISSNPRVPSPAQSPSPIPQPSASGGRPPSGLAQGNGPTFGSLGGDSDRHMRQVSTSQAPLAPGNQSGHMRRDSSQPGQGDMGNQGHSQGPGGPGRGGFPTQGGRGRGFNPQYQQQMGYPPTAQPFRNQPNQGRGGMAPPFQGQGRPMNPQFPNSPHQAARSPALANSLPGTPNMNQTIPMQNPQPFNNYYPPHMQGPQQQNYGFPPQGYTDRMGMPMQAAPYMYPQMQYMNGAPQAPQPGYQQPNAYIPGQYAPQAQPMSRNSSQVSDPRPASSMGQPGTPSMAPAHALAPQPKASPEPSTFTRPTRKSAAIVIKKPDGEALNVENLKAPASPAPKDRARTPPVIASTPTPPPKPSTPQHARSDSAALKTQEQVRAEIMEKVKKAAEATELATKADDAAKEDAEAKAKEEKAKEEAKAEAEAAAAAAAAAEKAKRDEEEELERAIREMEEAEAEREKKEAEILAKRAADKAAAEKVNEEKRLADAEENDRKLREQEREMERLEDERERKRAEAEAKAQDGDKADAENKDAESKAGADDRNAPATPTTIASKLSNLTLGTDSGASTPASDDSMPPPPPKASSTEKRGKPAALNLAPLNTKPVEPPQPSAALQSLKSARFLTVLNASIYPPNISSPNPALNSAVAAKGQSFKYDKEFLLQFQKVFTEKPSLEFAEQVKNLIGEGDGGSARSASTRQSSSMGPRQGSNRNPPGAFAMGSFGAVGAGGRTLPPGTTSAERFTMSTGSMARPAINPMASFNRPGGAFPGGSQMTRTPSSSAIGGGMPHSPRQQSRSQRGGSKRDGYQTGNAKAEAQAAKTMPLTAGMELKPIQTSANGWKPRSVGAAQSATGAAGPAPGAAGGHMDPDMVQRKVKAALNKMTPEKFDKIADQILAIAAQSKDEADGRTLRQVIQLTFEKATDEAHWASMYAKFCKRMLETMSPDIKDESILDKNGNVVSGGNLFRKYLLNRCQEEFERGWKIDLPEKPEDERGEEKTEEAAMLSDEYYIAAAAKRRGLGLVQFIGELYKLSMLTERIMHECVKKLVDYTGVPDEAEIESLTKLLKTIGANLDSTEKGKPMMDVYFTRIQAMIDTPELPSRLRFMLMDIVDLRKKNWQSKEANKGPKTLEEIRAEADAAAAQKAAESSRNQRGGGGGGGGRMQIGRGDSRNFSNQYGAQPPVDYTKNTVGMDDLRRLTNKGGANRQSSSQMSFAPTSLFSSRSNSRKAGPSGSQSRTGEDSGASSRTGTPPQQKEKVSSSVNAFSPLAGLGSGEAENPASPPSASNSPELPKATPAAAEKSEDKKESES